jgi:translocation and assembly module TamB
VTPDDSDMPEAVTAPRRQRRRAVLFAVLALIMVALLVLWTQRKPIASDYIDRYLAERHVAARYHIADLGFGRQRLTDVVLGPGDRPDLIADWIELRTHVGFSGLAVDEIRFGHVRLRGRVVDGRLSLGSLDRLLPPPSGKPFALPGIVADIADARMRLETPQGVIGLKATGFGRLDNGFDGHIAAVADRLDAGGCSLSGARALLRVQVTAGAPRLTGPTRVASARCGTSDVRGMGADITVALSATLDSWNGKARLAVARAGNPAGQLSALGGTIGFAGSASSLSGDLDLSSGRAQAQRWSASATKASGRYAIAGGRITFDGNVRGEHLVAEAGAVRAIAGQASSLDGTPLGPLARRLSLALAAAGRDLAVDGDIGVRIDRGGGQVRLSRLLAVAQSGAQLRLESGQGTTYRWPDGAMTVAGRLQFGGGGLPVGRVDLAQAAPGAPVTGTATLQPYAADDARLAAEPIRFTIAGTVTRIATRVSLSGPLANGRVEGLTLPIDARWNGRGALLVNPGCAPLSFQRLALSSVVLRPAAFALCPRDGAIYRLDRGVMGGGVHIAGAQLSGSIGSSPLTLSAATIDAQLARPGFAMSRVAVRIGAPDSRTRLDFATLGGTYAKGRLAGRFDGGDGQIGNVPLHLSKAAGDWRFANGALAVTGGLSVDDTATEPRFKTLAGRDVLLALRDGVITATGRLFSPTKNVAVADVAILHDLSHGTGRADLGVAGIAFSKAFQPVELTPLTLGVIADVNGTVSGEGHIRWTPDGVTSDGVFRTAGTDLAAAFGPVTGVSGEIRFTDLLNLESAPGQVATVKAVNPGVAVTNGTIRYQTLPGARIRIEQAEWPFAGGTLALEPTLLDFDVAQQRHLTFRVTAVDAGQFLQQFDFKNLNATGVFDGTLPMIFDQSGGRIEDGRLKMRPGGGTIAYLGEITEKDVGFWGNLAFQALRSLKYRDLDIVMNGPLSGEVITEVHFAGISQGAGAKRNFLFDRLQKLPFVFNVRIKAPFRSLIDSAQSIYDPRRLIERNLPALIEEQSKHARPPATPTTPVQPPDSRTMP